MASKNFFWSIDFSTKNKITTQFLPLLPVRYAYLNDNERFKIRARKGTNWSQTDSTMQRLQGQVYWQGTRENWL